jgi:hypothetical protein
LPLYPPTITTMPSAPVPYGFLHIIGLASRGPGKYQTPSFALHVSLANREIREPTSGLEPLSCSLRGRMHVLQGFADPSCAIKA